MENKRRFIESPDFPVREVNEKSKKEKGPGRPPYWEMVFYWTRKPLIGARAVIAGSLLPEDIDPEKFKEAIRLTERDRRGNLVEVRTPHRQNPQIPPEWERYFEGKKLLDPFAGFGSIPLEGLRLGLDVTAVELLPTTYVFLKAVLDYPKKFGKPLVEDVERWGNWITEQLKNDPEIRELYDEDVAVYIGTWEIKCPHCGRWTPAIGNYWLARVKDSNGYTRLAYMVPERNGEEVEIRVVDLNEVFGDVSKAEVDTKRNEITFTGENYVRLAERAVKEGKLKEKDFRVEGERVIFKVPSANIESRRNQLTCLACGNVIKYADESGRHYTERRKGNNEFYVKFALKKYHEGDERFARQRLLVKVKVDGRDLIFEPASREDNEKLWKAKEKVKELLEKGDPDIPRESVPPYGSLLFGALQIIGWGFDEWYKLFNPRQLLTLIKIVRLIREAGKRVEEEKLREGWGEERAFEYAEAVATYLSMAMLKYAYYDSVVTRWDSTWWKIGETMSTRGIAMNWNWTESPWFGEFGGLVKTLPALSRGLNYLTTALAPSSQKTLTGLGTNTVKVLQGDATSLSLGEKFDVIVTDPPYSIDVPYAELSDFYYVWLKRALSDSDGRKLIPRLHRTAFFKKIGPKWIEIKTQWQEFANKEVSEFSARFYTKEDKNARAKKHFEDLFSQAFVAMREHLKDDGIIVTYYAHTDPESWANLLNAGWKRAKLRITRAIPLSTESATSIMSRGKMSLNTSIVAMWRKDRKGGTARINLLEKELEERAMESAKELILHGYRGLDLLYGVMAAVLEVVTDYDEVRSIRGPLTTKEVLEKHVYPATVVGIIHAMSEVEEIAGRVTSPEALFYTAYKVLFGNATLPANDMILLNLATSTRSGELEAGGVVKRKGRNEYTLYSPDLLKEITTKELQKFLAEKGLNPLEPEPRNTVEVLHLLQYYSLLGRDRFKEWVEKLRTRWPAQVNEAVTMARLIVSYYEAAYSEDPRVKKGKMTIDEALRKDKAFDVTLMKRVGDAL